jgi:hypothetical protein
LSIWQLAEITVSAPDKLSSSFLALIDPAGEAKVSALIDPAGDAKVSALNIPSIRPKASVPNCDNDSSSAIVASEILIRKRKGLKGSNHNAA